MSLHPDILTALQEVDFLGEDRYRFRKARLREGSYPVRFMRSAQGAPKIVAEVAQRIYDHLYTRPRAPAAPIAGDEVADQEFRAGLSRADAALGRWSDGWTLLDKVDGKLYVRQQGGREMLVEPDQFEGVSGALGRVRVRRETANRQPGYFYAIGDAGGTPEQGSRTVRLYFNVSAGAAIKLMGTLTRSLNDRAIPFTYKTVSSPLGYVRADAGVLYLATTEWERARPALVETWAGIHRWLVDDTPLMTKRLAPGFGLAEDPATGESFGQHRSSLIAHALWAAHERGVRFDEQKRAVVAAGFNEAGLDPARPYLHGSVKDVY